MGSGVCEKTVKMKRWICECAGVAAVIAIVVVRLPGVGTAAPMANPSPKPTISSFAASPAAFFSTGGTVSLSANVTNATSCEFSSNKPVTGLPATVPCSNGTVDEDATVPTNSGKKEVTYKFSLAAVGSKTVKAKASMSVAPPRCSDIYPDASLQDCDLSGASLSGANLFGAILTESNLTGADLSGADLAGATMPLSALSGANLNDANLTAASMTDAKILDANLTDANLTGTVLTDAKLNGTDLAGANMNNTYLPAGNLDGISSGEITGTPIVLPYEWELLDGYLIGPDANLASADLNGANLNGDDLENTILSDALLSDANLSDVDLTNADLAGATLAGADVTNVIWSNTVCPDGTNSDDDGGTCAGNLS
jgi:uncharacterized protein YjbI with pentapeptide repeats